MLWNRKKCRFLQLRSTVPRNSDTASLEMVRAIIATTYLSEARARVEPKMLIQVQMRSSG